MLIEQVIYISSTGEQVDLLKEKGYMFYELSGHGANAIIKTTEIYGRHGTVPNYISARERKLQLVLVNFGHTWLSQTERVLELFPIMEQFTLILKNSQLSREISGIVESATPGSLKENDTFNIVLYCGEPYWTDGDNNIVDNSAFKPNFRFPLNLPKEPALKFGILRDTLMSELVNAGSLVTGFTATFTTKYKCSGVGIFNVKTREYLRCNWQLLPHEKIVFDTRTGDKTIYHYNAQGLRTNILYTMTTGSKFFQLERGKNVVQLQLQNGYIEHLSVRYEWVNYYAGV